jgi:hypothetical protein
MKSYKAIIILFIFILNTLQVAAQEVTMADTMRSEGKIYVVVTVACIVLIVISTFIINLDRKVSRLEKKIEKRS